MHIKDTILSNIITGILSLLEGIMAIEDIGEEDTIMGIMANTIITMDIIKTKCQIINIPICFLTMHLISNIRKICHILSSILLSNLIIHIISLNAPWRIRKMPKSNKKNNATDQESKVREESTGEKNVPVPNQQIVLLHLLPKRNLESEDVNLKKKEIKIARFHFFIKNK